MRHVRLVAAMAFCIGASVVAPSGSELQLVFTPLEVPGAVLTNAQGINARRDRRHLPAVRESGGIPSRRTAWKGYPRACRCTMEPRQRLLWVSSTTRRPHPRIQKVTELLISGAGART